MLHMQFLLAYHNILILGLSVYVMLILIKSEYLNYSLQLLGR